MVNIATIAENLKIFSYNNGKLSEKGCVTTDYQNSSTNVVWAGNGVWACGGPDVTGNVPIYKYEDCTLLRMRTFEEGDASVASFFRWTNKEIVIGKKSGAINIWAIKNKKILTTFCEDSTQPIKRLAISSDDAALAAATPANIKIFGLTTKRQTSKIDIRGEISDMQFSGLRKNILGGCTMESGVYVWDTYKGIPILEVTKAHAGACSGVAMSPINYQLMASSSLSKTVKLHDIRKKEPVWTLPMDYNLSAIDMVQSYSLCLGTLDGFLMILDLRNSEVVDRISAHASAISSVRAAPSIPDKKFEETAIYSPDEEPIKNHRMEVSITDILSPPVGASSRPEIDPSPIFNASTGNTPINIQRLRMSTSPFDLVQIEMRRRASHSTPNVGLNDTDSFLNMIATPNTERTNSFNSRATLERTNSFNGKPILDSPPQNASSGDTHNGNLEITPQLKNQAAEKLDKVLEALNAVRNDLETVRSEVKELREETKSIRERVEDHHGLLLDLREEIMLMPYYLRWDRAIMNFNNSSN